MLHTVVKFGSCNELTTFITLTQVRHAVPEGLVFEKAVVDAFQDDSLSANQCRSPFGVSTRLQASGYL